ncbi:MAG TPA: NAD(P)H-quinone dehydrogenase [Mycobacteriales bacterium]|nr:NAD(P)H-quinone dehydrogenase [Mycobacteriales bacterium]
MTTTRIAIMGGGPAGYEAALVAAQLGAEVTLVERDAVGGACVAFDCVPSKTFIATSESMTALRDSGSLGVRAGDPARVRVDAPVVHERVKRLAMAQSHDIHGKLREAGVDVRLGTARFAEQQDGRRYRIEVEGSEPVLADVVLLATGATPRILPDARPDGERILTWRQVYDLPALPEHLIVVGSGVTGAEFASAYTEMGVPVTLVSSRDRVLPGEDSDAAMVLEEVFTKRGMQILSHSRASSVQRRGDEAVVTLTDGREIVGSHVLMTVGSVPNTSDLGLENVGVELDSRGNVDVDRVSRTSARGIYAAGDCTGVLMLASVAGMQGRIAMWHALGQAVSPLKLRTVSANVFTHPEIATVGVQQRAIEAGKVSARTVTLPLATNARAKMQGITDGFVKLFCNDVTGIVIGGVVVAPAASELILPITLAVQNGLTVDRLAQTFTVYPSLTGSLAEAARQLMRSDDLD